MINCGEAINRLWEYLDDTVEPADRAGVEEHLDRCRTCCGELEFVKELRRRLAVPGDLNPVVLERLNQTLDRLGDGRVDR